MAVNGGINGSLPCGQPCNAIKHWKWDIKQFTTCQINPKYAVLILNRPISQNPEFINRFWNGAAVRMTVDGGTHQWDKFVNTLPGDAQKTLKLPDLITGDFDSITEDILNRYRKKGCKTIHTPDQDYTDFTKALMELRTYCTQQSTEMENIVAIGQSSGRLDQILGNIQTLFLAQEKNILSSNSRLYLMTDDSISWLLYPGNHIINIPENVREHKRAWCSLVPIGTACESITTSGLKWNLANQSLKFGEMISTSNSYSGSDTVTIKCSHPVLWSMKIPGLKSGP